MPLRVMTRLAVKLKPASESSNSINSASAGTSSRIRMRKQFLHDKPLCE